MKVLVMKRDIVYAVMKHLSAFECKKVFVLKETKVNDKWARDTAFKIISSLTVSYYPTTKKPSVGKPFRFMTHKWAGVKK